VASLTVYDEDSLGDQGKNSLCNLHQKESCREYLPVTENCLMTIVPSIVHIPNSSKHLKGFEVNDYE